MFWKLVAAGLVVGLVVWAIRSRVKIKRSRSVEMSEMAVASPASVAIGELVAIAGGIYLSLVLLVSFLKIDILDKMNLFNTTLDPLALIAVALAILQPIVVALYYRLMRKF